MPIAIILLHFGLVCAAILLLMLLCSTGNWADLLPATTWIAVDLLVSVTSMALCLRPDYAAALAPGLVRAHFLFFVLAVAWMGLDALRAKHPLSAIFFFAFAAVLVGRVFQFLAARWRFLGFGSIEALNALIYLAAVFILVQALLLPIPPEPAHVPTVAEHFPRRLTASLALRERAE